MSLYGELKRRNVFRVAIAYLAGAWLLIEVAGTLFPAFGVPDWAVRFVVVVLALGFLPALIISWAYELTPEGLKREKGVIRDTSITHVTAKRLDGITIGLIIVTLTFILADRFWKSPRSAEQSTAPGVSGDRYQGTVYLIDYQRKLVSVVSVYQGTVYLIDYLGKLNFPRKTA